MVFWTESNLGTLVGGVFGSIWYCILYTTLYYTPSTPLEQHGQEHQVKTTK